MQQPTPRTPRHRGPVAVEELRTRLMAAAGQIRDHLTSVIATAPDEAGLVPPTDWDLRTPHDPQEVVDHPEAHSLLSGLLPDAECVYAYARLWNSRVYPEPTIYWRGTRTVIEHEGLRIGVEVWGMVSGQDPHQQDQ